MAILKVVFPAIPSAHDVCSDSLKYFRQPCVEASPCGDDALVVQVVLSTPQNGTLVAVVFEVNGRLVFGVNGAD